MKGLIKNVKKYRVVKYPQGIGLKGKKAVYRKGGEVGISTSKFGGSWFVTDKGRALFKSYNMETQGIRVVNELLYDELAKQVGLPIAQYMPANYWRIEANFKSDNYEIKDRDYFGLASIDVTKKNEKIMTGYELLTYDKSIDRENTLKDYADALCHYKECKKYNVDIKGIMSVLYKMMVLDALTLNEDRHSGNVFFIRNDKEKYLIASPVIDNELCFFGADLWLFWSKKMKHLDSKKFFTKYAKRMWLCFDRDTYDAKFENAYEKNVEALVELANKDIKTKKFLNNAIANININEAFENVEKMGYEVTPEYKGFVKDLMTISTGMFKKHMKEFNMQKQTNQENQL